MGCNCGGNKTGSGSGKSGLTQYRLTFPDGRVQVYLQQHQAEREQARRGGTIEVIHV